MFQTIMKLLSNHQQFDKHQALLITYVEGIVKSTKVKRGLGIFTVVAASSNRDPLSPENL